MGLYLCVFDEYGNDVCGVEVGLYKYFAEFRQKVATFVDDNRFTSKMPTLLQHLDCDGSWSVSDCKLLINELTEIKEVFQQEPPITEIQNLKRFRILSERYRNRRKRFSFRFSLIAGICNFDRST